MIYLRAIATAFICLVSISAHAATVSSRNGHHASVSSYAAPRFQCLINRLERAGYRIDFMGGYGARGGPSAHPTGNAIDINQTGFGRVTRRLPSGFVDMADACGVFSGSHFGDTGHFEMPHKYGYVHLEGYHHERHRYRTAGRHRHGEPSFGFEAFFRPDYH